MKTFLPNAAVEVVYDERWVQATYLGPYDDKVTALTHSVVTDHYGEVDVADDCIRAVPVFQAFGDDLRLTAEALAHYAHERVRVDMERNGGLTDDTLAVQRLHERAKAAMEVAR